MAARKRKQGPGFAVHCSNSCGGDPHPCWHCRKMDSAECYPLNPDRDPALEAVLAWNYEGFMHLTLREEERCGSPSRWRSAMAFWLAYHKTESIVHDVKMGQEDFAAEHIPELLRDVKWARDRAEKLISTLERIQTCEARQRDAHPVRSGRRSGGRARRTEGGGED